MCCCSAAWPEPKSPDRHCPGSCAPIVRALSHPRLRNMPCDSAARQSALIPMHSHELPWLLLGVGRREALGVRQLAAALLLCPNNLSVPISHIPHQPDDRSCDPFPSRKSGHRTYTGRVRRRIAALLPTRWRKHRRSGARPSSAAST